MRVFLERQYNEICSIKLAVMRALSSLSAGRKGQFSAIRTSCVDLPLSAHVLNMFFPLDYNGEKSVKKDVAVSDLDVVFGKDWNIFYFDNSSTRKRVFGLVTLHYRQKSMNSHKLNSR